MKICLRIAWNATSDRNETTKVIGSLANIMLCIVLTTGSPYTYTYPSILSCGRKSGFICEQDPLPIPSLPLHMTESGRQASSLVFHGEYWSLCWFTCKPHLQNRQQTFPNSQVCYQRNLFPQLFYSMLNMDSFIICRISLITYSLLQLITIF